MGWGQLSYDVSWLLALEGRIYVASDADQNDRVTGQTSFANTTPTFLLNNAATNTVVCVPFYYQIGQTGSVAGGDIGVETEVRSGTAFASGGTTEGTSSLFFGQANYGGTPTVTNQCTLLSGATASSGQGRAMGHVTLAPDVSPAEGVINIYEWQAPTGLILGPDSSLGVYTYAASTGPTWGWHFCWCEIPLSRLPRL